MLVIGVDVGLVDTGVAVIANAQAVQAFTIGVEGDTQDTGPRYVYLRRALAIAAGRIIAPLGQPELIALEIPDEDEGVDGYREGHEKMHVAKLYGAYAVLYAEAARLWPKAHLVSVTPRQWKGSLGKKVTVRMMTAKYAITPKNSHEADALGIADWARDVAIARKYMPGKYSLGRAGKV